MHRKALERHQVWGYLAAIVLGLLIGTAWPAFGRVAEPLVWPVLAALLYATFTQTPLGSIPAAFADKRFLFTALLGNFAVMPLLVFCLVQLTPNDQALRLGLLLVLLVPCTDWFITFTQIGGGDAVRATALTPITLVLQLLLLPGYLWLMSGLDLAFIFTLGDVWPALLVVLAPLGLAAFTEVWARRRPARARAVERLGWAPVPLLALVLLLIAGGHVGAITASTQLLPVVAGVTAAYLAVSLVVAKSLSLAGGLSATQGRTLAFSLGTRNSFIVLPFALSLPAGWEIVPVVIVMQSLVELFGMIAYLWAVPRVAFRSSAPGETSNR